MGAGEIGRATRGALVRWWADLHVSSDLLKFSDLTLDEIVGHAAPEDAIGPHRVVRLRVVPSNHEHSIHLRVLMEVRWETVACIGGFMSKELQKYHCDVCGKPATSMARDVALHEPPHGGFAIVRPVGDVKHGCDEHPAKGVEHRTGWPVQERER